MRPANMNDGYINICFQCKMSEILSTWTMTNKLQDPTFNTMASSIYTAKQSEKLCVGEFVHP